MVDVLKKGDENWPSGLADLGKEEPMELWYEGDIHLLEKKCVCVVGSRRITDYGRRVVEKMVPTLVDSGAVVVSGFMYGTDQAVHREVLVCGGKTIAVLGWGIGFEIEKKDRDLWKKIVEDGGLVISEWKKQPGALWTFPRRDRIMAALGSDIYVVEAAMKSGSLITAEWGRKLKRRIWAVPGPITSKVSEGTNWLIATDQASLWNGQDIYNKQVDTFCNIKDTELYVLLQNEMLTIDELARRCNMIVSDVGAQLSVWELEGKVKERGGKYYLEGS